MATSTTTIRPTPITFGACAAESDRLYCFRSLYEAYISCRRRKRNTINALRFEASLLDNLADLGETLSDGSYKPSRSVCFVAKQPKLREIFAADFRDRVVHHLELKQRIADFLKERLALELKAECTLKRVSEGANFLGYIVRPDYVLVRNRVIGNLRARLRSFQDEMVQYAQKTIIPAQESLSFPLVGNLSGEGLRTSRSDSTRKEFLIRIHLREENVIRLRQTLASYLGHFKHANAYRLTLSLFEKYPWLTEIFELTENNPLPPCGASAPTVGKGELRLRPLYEPAFEPAGLGEQYRWVTKRYGAYCIFFQVGRFCEFYGRQAETYGAFFGLKPQPEKRKNGLQCGFPVRYLKEFKEKAFRAGMPYVVVGERGYYPSGLKKRVVTEILRAVELQRSRAVEQQKRQNYGTTEIYNYGAKWK